MIGAAYRRKRIVILGSTGSIGRNTLKVVNALPDRFEIVALAARSDWRALAAQARRFKPLLVAVADRDVAARLRDHLGWSRSRVLEGEEGVASLATAVEADLVVSAIVGSPGLVPTWRAVRAGVDVALANKEPLVMAGGLITAEAANSGAAIIPVDSEHHALHIALRGLRREEVEAVSITASGGPFLRYTAARMKNVTVAQALRHPRWRMGSKISIDSATLMNKGLEVIEAHWLFGFPEDRIRVVVHPESIIHGMVHLADGGVLAFLSRPDMRLPIAAALNHPLTIDQGLAPLNLARAGNLTFMPPDHRRFPCLPMAREALRTGGTAPTVLNAANEVAVSAFIGGIIRFPDIAGVIRAVVDAVPTVPASDLETILDEDRKAKELAGRVVGGKARNFAVRADRTP